MPQIARSPAVASQSAPAWRAWSVAEAAADVLHVPESQVYGLIARGELRAVKIGRHWRIADSVLRELVGQTPSSEAA